MGLFDFFKKKTIGIDDTTFNSTEFQTEICHLTKRKLEEHNFRPEIAVYELKKRGLDDTQIKI